MFNPGEQIKLLSEKLDILLQKQQYFAEEITAIRTEIEILKKTYSEEQSNATTDVVNKITPAVEKPETPIDPELEAYLEEKDRERFREFERKNTKRLFNFEGIDLEKFIGENLINKIGILITVIGVGIGTKYSIEHQLISPVTRIVLGYLLGIALLVTGIKLKEKYRNYSAVLVSGAMAIMYMTTFTAYSLYQLIPQEIAFGLMVVFTVFTVVTALNYDRQIIALLGLVGAYAIPFLLSDGSGKVAVMFTYMAIINTGILVIAFKKYWQQLYYSAFGFTWLIYLSWFATKYDENKHLALALGFAVLFYILFYLAFLAYKLIKKEKYKKYDIVLLLSNSFIFYGIGYHIIHSHPELEKYTGLFTLMNALLHFGVGIVFYRNKLADKNLFYLVTGLALVFLTLSVPVQLSGKWITLLWIGEASVLYWIGTAKKIPFYRNLAYPLVALATFSLYIDWMTGYARHFDAPANIPSPLWNTDFLNSLLFAGGLGFINYNKLKYGKLKKTDSILYYLLEPALPLLLIFTLYMMFYLEIGRYWDLRYTHSEIALGGTGYGSTAKNRDLLAFKSVWLVNYSLMFISLLAVLNYRKIKNVSLAKLSFVFLAVSIFIFLTLGLYQLSELRDAYLEQADDGFVRSRFYLYIRYISLGFLILAVYTGYIARKQAFLAKCFEKKQVKIFMETTLTSILLWVLSSELLQWMALAHNQENYKLGLSIFWGVFALILVGAGIKYHKKHLRIFAISLFAVTLIKLFLYDLRSLSTLSKTIVFVALGVLLLIISFLYNKFKDDIGLDDD